jgi:hypothetical protein
MRSPIRAESTSPSQTQANPGEILAARGFASADASEMSAAHPIVWPTPAAAARDLDLADWSLRLRCHATTNPPPDGGPRVHLTWRGIDGKRRHAICFPDSRVFTDGDFQPVDGPHPGAITHTVGVR